MRPGASDNLLIFNICFSDAPGRIPTLDFFETPALTSETACNPVGYTPLMGQMLLGELCVIFHV